MLLVVFVTIIGTLPSIGAETKLNLSTPQSAMNGLYSQLSREANNPAQAATMFNAKWLGEAELIRRAEDLKIVMDSRGLLPLLNNIPNDSNYVDARTGKAVYQPFALEPRFFLEKVGRSWMLSGATVSSIPEMYSEVLPFGMSFILREMPQQGSMFFGVFIWQYVGFALMLLLAFVFGRIVRAIAVRLLKRLLTKWEMPSTSIIVLKSIGKPLSLFTSVSLIGIFQPVLRLPVDVSAFIVLAIDVSLPVLAIIMAYRFVDLLSIRAEQLAERTVSLMDDQLIPILRKTIKFFVILAGFVLLLQHLGFDITALLAGISIGGLALAFAAQDTIRNMFGSVMLFLDRPFTVGDWVTFEGVDGCVEEVGFRSTRLRTLADTLVTVPNGRLADMTVDNFGLRVFRRYRTTLGVVYSTPPEVMKEFITELRRIISDHPATVNNDPRSLVHFREFASSSLNIEVQIYIDCSNMANEWRAREELNFAFLELAGRLGVSYAFPSQSLYLESVPERSTLTK